MNFWRVALLPFYNNAQSKFALFHALFTHMYISSDIYVIEPAIKVACSSVYLSSGGGGGGRGVAAAN